MHQDDLRLVQVTPSPRQLRQLGYKVIVIGLALAVQRAVPVPGREIDAKAYTTPAAGIRHFPYHVPLACTEGAACHRMVGILTGPQAETSVMLAGENQPLHVRCAQGIHPLIGIKGGGIEASLGFRSVSPFPAGGPARKPAGEPAH